MGLVEDPMAAVEAETMEGAEVVVAMVMVPVHPHGRGGNNNNNCHHCGKPGHWVREYRNKQPKTEEQAYATQEEESSLLLTEVEPNGGDLVIDGGNGHVTGGGYSPDGSRTPTRETTEQLRSGFTNECSSKGA
jgi:PP-loop superfamily ATP-utilizing enzyme